MWTSPIFHACRKHERPTRAEGNFREPRSGAKLNVHYNNKKGAGSDSIQNPRFRPSFPLILAMASWPMYHVCKFNQFSCTFSGWVNFKFLLHHTVWRTWLFTTYSNERWLYIYFIDRVGMRGPYWRISARGLGSGEVRTRKTAGRYFSSTVPSKISPLEIH